MKRKALESLDKNGRITSASNRTPKPQSKAAKHKTSGQKSTINLSGRHRRAQLGPLWNTETKTPRISNCAEKATELRAKTRNLRATEPGTSIQSVRGTNETGKDTVQEMDISKYARIHRQANLIERQSKEIEMDVESPGMLSELSGLDDEPSTTESGTRESFQESALKRIAAAAKSSPTAKRAKMTRLETPIGRTSNNTTGKTKAHDCVPGQITIKSQTKHQRLCEAGQDKRNGTKFVDFEHEPRPHFFSDGTFEELRKHALSPDNKQVFDAVNNGTPRLYQQQDGLSGITIGGPRLKRVDSLEDEDITIDSHGSMYVNPNTNGTARHEFKHQKGTDLSSEEHLTRNRIAKCATKDEQKNTAFIDFLYNETIIHSNTGPHTETQDQSTKHKAKDNRVFIPCRSPDVVCCPEVWSLPDDKASTNSKNFIFEIKGKKFYHPALPPGWKLEVAASQSRPFYVHPDHGLTYYCPVPLPVKPTQTVAGNKLQVRPKATAQLPKHTSTRGYCHSNHHDFSEIARHTSEIRQSSDVRHSEHFPYDSSSNNDDDESSLMLSPSSACTPPGLKNRLPSFCPTAQVLSSIGRPKDCDVSGNTRSLEDMDISSQMTDLFSSASSDDERGDGSVDTTGETYSAQKRETRDPETGLPEKGSGPSKGRTLAMQKLSVNTIEPQNQWGNALEKSCHKEDELSSIDSVGEDHICSHEVQKTGEEQDNSSLGFNGSNEDEDGGLAPYVQKKATPRSQAKSGDLANSSPLAKNPATTTGEPEKNIEIDAGSTNIRADVGKTRLPVASSSTSATSVQSTDDALVQGTPNVITTQKSEIENGACVPGKNGSTCSSACTDSDTEGKGTNVVETVAVVRHAMDKHERPLVITSPSNSSSSSSPHPRVVNLEESTFSQPDDNSPIVVKLEESNFRPADDSPRVVSFEESNFPSADDDEASALHSWFNGKRLDEAISKTPENSVESGSVAGSSLSATGSHTSQVCPQIFDRTVKMPDRQCSLQNLARFREKGRYPYRFSASGKFPEPRMPVARKKQ